jgi:hypothetical protein
VQPQEVARGTLRFLRPKIPNWIGNMKPSLLLGAPNVKDETRPDDQWDV